MIPWFQVYTNLPSHPKIYKLAEAVNVSNYAAVGIMTCIWAWASVNIPDGDLSGYPNPCKTINDIIGWKNKKTNLFQALVNAGFIDTDNGKVTFHDWDDYSAKGYFEKKEKQRSQGNERQKKYREKQKNNALHNGDITPYSTVHNNTVHDAVSPLSDGESEKRVEKYKSDWNEITGSDITKQACNALIKAENNNTEPELITKIIRMAAEKETPSAWFDKVIGNLIADNITTCGQYEKRYSGKKQQESDGGSFDTDEFFELAVKRTYENMEKINRGNTDDSGG